MDYCPDSLDLIKQIILVLLEPPQHEFFPNTGFHNLFRSDFNVPFNADIGKVVDVLIAAMERAAVDPEIAGQLLEPPVIQGWNSFSPWAVQVRLMAETRPEKRLEVATLLRRYGLEALKQAGLQVAVPLPDSLAGA